MLGPRSVTHFSEITLQTLLSKVASTVSKIGREEQGNPDSCGGVSKTHYESSVA